MEMNALFSYVMMLVMVVAFAHSQDTYEMTINSTSLSTSLPQDDQGANNGLTNVIIIIIIVMILEIIMIISCLVIFCICFIKRKKKSADTSYYVVAQGTQSLRSIKSQDPSNQLRKSTSPLPVEYLTILDDELDFNRTLRSENSEYYKVVKKELITTQTERLGLNTLLPSPEPVQSALQNESQTVVPSTSNEPVYSVTVVTKNSLTVQEETYDRLKHNRSSNDHIGSDKGSNEEYSRIGCGIKTVYNTLESVMDYTEMDLHSYDTNNEVCDSFEHAGSGNNHIGSCEYSTAESHVDDVLENKHDMHTIFDDPDYASTS